jgi:putative transcriptional regulator
MIHHDHQGAMGVVINRPSDKTIREVWELIGNDPCERDDRIYVGGPVPGPLVALHSLQSFSDDEVLPGLFYSTHRDVLDRIVQGDLITRIDPK